MTQLTLIILGGAGDLTRRLLLPGLAQYMATDDSLKVSVVGVGYQPQDDYATQVGDALTDADVPADLVDTVVGETSWVTADATSADDLGRLLSDRVGRTIVYFALSPAITKKTVDALAGVALPSGMEFVLEKPFGTDADSARALTEALHRFTDEDHIVRSDHFLGMSGTVNLRGLLETNRPLADTWDGRDVESLTFVFDETLGLEGRAQFYDATGAARDMLQSHLIQTMGHSLADPADGSSGAAKILAATSLDGDVTVAARRARYTTGSIHGHTLPDYTAEDGVDASRNTETLAEVRLSVDTDDWRGVPITLRSGKAIGDPRQEITVHYKPVGDARGTTLRLGFDDDAVVMEINISDPGHPENLQRATFHTHLMPSKLSAYGRVVRGLVRRSGATKLHADSPVRAWEILQPVFDAFADGSVPLGEYPAGSGGPAGW
ncbi:glucose-6-phosphate dehydrogenase [Tessaracoccus antarcticus]|uniref:Glucose-6-phosphate dehydrogenase n=1 Tax=Tessaracoccus antarcticus TaxID=2479848 RepID=A0A3M0GD02_9ACTN|nr:glucose-6-phosphate dehydrogenase [Tessaracoccus antarcticus]RMB62407.1 glucose-6-phosphate dehydrogenase [Tessaracoccus antarcticus]